MADKTVEVKKQVVVVGDVVNGKILKKLNYGFEVDLCNGETAILRASSMLNYGEPEFLNDYCVDDKIKVEVSEIRFRMGKFIELEEVE